MAAPMVKRAWQKLSLKRLQNTIDRLPVEARQGARDALRMNGNEGKRIIKGDVPVDDGALLSSVDWSWGDPPPGVLGAGEKRNTGVPEDMRISIYAGGPKAPHAHLVHNGTAERTTQDGASRGVMPPQAFFWPNIRSLRRRFKGRITRMVRKGLKRAVK